MINAGKNLIQGLIDGIANMGGKVVEAIGNIANSAIDTVKSWFGIASPSKVFRQLGIYTMEGFVVGINRMSSTVDRAMASTASDVIDTMKETLSRVGKDISDGFSSDISIKPILDLTDVNKGIDSMYSAFDRTASISLGTTNSRAVSALKASPGSVKASQSQIIYNNNYDLTQNNYSPKALSRIDISRDTKNQFSRLKGVNANDKLSYRH